VRRATAVLALVALVAAPACSKGEGAPRPTVAASFFPLAEVARAVAGRDADVIDLTPPGQDPHGLTELTATAIAGADVLVHLGRGFQPAVDELAASFEGKVVDGLEALPVVDDDVHVWLDPTMLGKIATAVADALSEADPDHAEAYASNVQRYLVQLSNLDRRLVAGLSTCARNIIVSAHAAWRYFTSRYRLEQEPLAGVSPGEPPAPGRAEELVALVRDAGVTTVFREPLVPDGPISALAATTGARIATLDPLEGRVDTGPGGTYIELMGRNLSALRSALGCR
jgi:zinc transport system substrate-binding protein